MTRLFGSAYTTDYLMEKCFPDQKNIRQNVHCEIRSMENARSFWSMIGRLQLKWKDEEDSDLPSSLFIKVPCVTDNSVASDQESEMESLQQTLVNLTKKEEQFYRALNNVIVPGFPYPRYYYGEEVNEIPGLPGCLILEDFSGKVTASDYIPGFTIQQVEALMCSLASWHAFIFKDKSNMVEKFDDLDTDFDEDFCKLLYDESVKLEDYFPERLRGRISPLGAYFTQEHTFDSIRSYKDLGIPPVLVHMDMNTTNVLWKEGTSSTEPQIAAVIDFQNVHMGNLCEDMARILQLAVSVETRRLNEEPLFALYHAKLVELMGEEKCPVTLDQVRAAYARVFPYVANFSLFAVNCYYNMYNDLEEDEKVRREKQEELMQRAAGIVEDIYRFRNIQF